MRQFFKSQIISQAAQFLNLVNQIKAPGCEIFINAGHQENCLPIDFKVEPFTGQLIMISDSCVRALEKLCFSYGVWFNRHLFQYQSTLFLGDPKLLETYWSAPDLSSCYPIRQIISPSGFDWRGLPPNSWPTNDIDLDIMVGLGRWLVATRAQQLWFGYPPVAGLHQWASTFEGHNFHSNHLGPHATAVIELC